MTASTGDFDITSGQIRTTVVLYTYFPTLHRHQHSLEYITVHDTDEVFISRDFPEIPDYLEFAESKFGGKSEFTHLWLKDAYFVPFQVTR